MTTQIDDIIARIERATAQWDGLSWDSDLDASADVLESGDDARIGTLMRSLDDGAEGIRSWYGAGRPADEDVQRHRAAVERLAREIAEGGDVATLAAAARELADAEARDVEERAEAAADCGERAIAALLARDYAEAAGLLREAATIERQYGDAPAWGGLAEAVDEIARVELAAADAEAEAAQ